MPYNIDEENSELSFEVTGNDRLVIKVKSGAGGGGGGSDIYVIKLNEPTEPSDKNVFSSLRSLAEFISKTKPDETQFLLRLRGGAEFGSFASGISGGKISPDGAAELLTLLLRGAMTIGNYEAGKSGAKIDEEGVAELLAILVRNGIESDNFSTGALGSGFCLKKDENGDSYLEVDRMLVRKVATFIQLLIQQIKHVGGQIILTPASMSCSSVEDLGNYYRCYFENTDGEKTIEQEFVVGDLARAQTFNVKEGVNENVSNSYYWRAVVGVGDNYIDLSKTDCDAGSTEPQAGDDIVQLGNKSDATRQAAIILSAYGNDAPYFKLYRGINSYSLDGKEFVSFSRSEVMIIADAIKFSSGESVKDYIDNAVGEVNTKVDDAISDLSENISFVNQLSKDLEAVKNQIDGAIETWFYEPVPTLSNEPAVNWTTNEDKNVHLGDLYYDGNGKAYRFQMSGTSYVWQVITDSDITKALADAKKAQDTADGKRRVFVTTPSNASAYDVGDLWVNATYGSYKNDLLRCKTSKQANAQFSIEHWELATRYTDDTKANQAIEDAANAKAAADNAQTDANEAKERLDSWASDGSISPTEKQSLKEEISRIDADKTQISNGYAKYNLGTPTNYNNAHTAYRAVLVTLTASSPETITIPSDFSTKQTTYYTQRTNALTAISNAARDYAQGIANDLNTYKQTVSSQFEQTNNSITAAVTSSKEYTNNAINNIQIGGRNLFRNTKNGGNWYANNWGTGKYTVSKEEGISENVGGIPLDKVTVFLKTQAGTGDIKMGTASDSNISYTELENKNVTISFYAKCQENIKASMVIAIQNKYNANISSKAWTITELSDNWVKYQYTFPIDKTTNRNGCLIFFTIPDSFLNKKIYICLLKGEISNKASDWSPAPEDSENALTEYKKEVTAQFSVLEGEISSKVSSTEMTTIKQEIINTAASDATKKANDAKTSAISTASADATSKANKAKQDAISTAATDATNKANQAKNDAITTAGQNADKKYATITTVSSMQTSITQLSNSLSLKAEKSEVTAVQNNLNQTNNNLSALTTRVSKAEVALEPDNIWIGISSKVTTTGKLNNIVPDSCFDDTNYSLLYSGGQRIQKDSAPSGCPTNYCMKSTANIVYANNGVSVALGEKYYISAVVNASSANYEVLVGLMLKSNTGSYSYLPIEGVVAKTSGWQTISGYVTIPNNILDARIYFKINGTSNLGTAYFTKVYAYKVDESVNQNYALLTSTEKKLTTFSNISNQTWNVYNITGLKKGDIITVSFEYEASNLNFNTTTEHTAKINCQFGPSYGWAGTTFDLKSNGSGKYISKPITVGGTATETTKDNIFFRLDYISSVLQDNNPIGYFRVWKMKVEKGERSTPWSAAPSDYSTTEEIKSGIGITKNEVSIFGKKISLSGMITFSSCDSDLQSTINSKADSSEITASKDDIAKKLGYSSYADMVNKASAGNTIINGGYIRTSLIDADTLVVKTLNAANSDGVSTLVNKDGMKMTQGSNVLFKLTSNKATVGTTRYYAQMDLTTVYSDGSTLQGTLTPESLFLRGKTKSTDKTLKTTLMYNGLMIYDENGTGLTVNTKGAQLTYCTKTQSGGYARAVVHYAKCIFSAYITASGYLNSSIGASIPNSSGTPIEFSVSRTRAGRYKVTHNINDQKYFGQITALSNGSLTVGIFENRNSTSFDYSTISFDGNGWYAKDCGVYLSIYYESPKLFTF